MSKNKSCFYELGDMFPLVFGSQCDGISICNNRYYQYYSNLALNRFRWENLPEGITSRDMEKQLFVHGQVFFTDTNDYGYICLKASDKAYDLYGNPKEVEVFGLGYENCFDIKDGVLIRENDLSYPPFIHLLHYIEVCDEVDKTARMNLGQQRFPVIIPKTANTELSINRFQEKVFNEYFPVQVVDKKLEKALGSTGGSIDTVKALNTGVPFILNDLQDFKHDKESELYTFLGLNNANTDKKERLITSEVDANNGQIMMSLDISFKNRQLACEEINKKYGLNIKVYKVIDELNKSKNGEEGETDEYDEEIQP